MSPLAEAVLDIAQGMEEAAQQVEEYESWEKGLGALKSFARELRTACKIAGRVQELEGEILKRLDDLVNRPALAQASSQDSDIFNRSMIDAERNKIRAQREGSKIQESLGTRMIEAIDGALDGTAVGVKADMQVNERVLLGNQVYCLCEDGLLHHDPEQTRKMV